MKLNKRIIMKSVTSTFSIISCALLGACGTSKVDERSQVGEQKKTVYKQMPEEDGNFLENVNVDYALAALI